MDNLIPENLDKFDKQFHDTMEVLTTSLVTYGLDFISAIIVLVVGWWLSDICKKMVAKTLSRIKNADATLVNFISSAVRYAILIVTLIAVLARFGVQTTSLIAVLGAAGLAIGLALQGTLSNVAAGVMLLLFRPYRIGQYVDIGGKSGTVRDLDLFTTELDMIDNVHITIPNSNIWGSPITNYSHNTNRRMDLDIAVGYNEDINSVLDVLRTIVNKDKRILHDKGPEFFVKTLGEASMILTARFWTKNSDYWAVKFAMNQALKETLQSEGIDIFPAKVTILTDKAPKNTKTKAKTKTKSKKIKKA